MVRPHGPHECYCPSCGYREEVGEYVKCNTRSCPKCGSRLRAEDTGEYRSRISNGVPGEKACWPLLLLGAFIGGTVVAIAKSQKG